MNIKKISYRKLEQINLDDNSCVELIKDIDNRIASKDITSSHYGNTEFRIFDYLDKNFICSSLEEQLIEWAKKNSLNLELKTCLAIRNSASGYDSSFNDGRWHLDSLNNEYKFFVYLNNVNPGNGQLQIIDKTHTFFFKMKHIILSNYLSIFDLFSGKRKYQSLKDSFIKKLTKKFNIIDIVSNRGGIFFVNSSSIHRACPIESNVRYALTFYMKEI